MGKIDTTTLLLIGAAVVAVYLLTKKPTVTPMYTTTPSLYPAGYNPYLAAQPNATAQDIAAGGTALSQLATAASNLF